MTYLLVGSAESGVNVVYVEAVFREGLSTSIMVEAPETECVRLIDLALL